ncbi:MAG TPA: ribbon-helix-helix protein, CopG family [Candidatus Kapabacteria bacterium]
MESTLHISHIDESLMRSLESLAEKEHTSVEEMVRRYLKKLGGNGSPPVPIDPSKSNRRSVIRKLSGAWSEEEAREFEDATAPFRTVDESLWK